MVAGNTRWKSNGRREQTFNFFGLRPAKNYSDESFCTRYMMSNLFLTYNIAITTTFTQINVFIKSFKSNFFSLLKRLFFYSSPKSIDLSNDLINLALPFIHLRGLHFVIIYNHFYFHHWCIIYRCLCNYLFLWQLINLHFFSTSEKKLK